MSRDVGTIVGASVSGLGYELVDFERTASGLLRVFIDKPEGIGVEDCADVSNHLSRVFLVENIDFSRLEVSSPGLDRPVKTLADFARFAGSKAKVKLSTMIDQRKRFDGTIKSVVGESVVFSIANDDGGKSAGSVAKKSPGNLKAKEKKAASKPSDVLITVPFDSIERARLIPEI
ncbi:MAG: ribosome maturation factor RimP [Betaproteobacteria bacterium]|nr:ribosome maturation factor RimP [Betaproteobacteria bacterium]